MYSDRPFGVGVPFGAGKQNEGGGRGGYAETLGTWNQRGAPENTYTHFGDSTTLGMVGENERVFESK